MAERLGVSTKTVRTWAHQGAPHEQPAPRKPIRWQLAALEDWLAEHHRTGKPGRPKTLFGDDDMADAKLRKERALARYHELRVGKEEGRLIAREGVEAGLVERARVLREGLQSLPRQLATQLLGLKTIREIEGRIAAGIEQCLRRYAGTHDDSH